MEDAVGFAMMDNWWYDFFNFPHMRENACRVMICNTDRITTKYEVTTVRSTYRSTYLQGKIECKVTR